jgi:hypothetical protein
MSDHRKKAPTQSYYVISHTDEEGVVNAVAIHKLADSAAAYFKKLIADGDFQRYLELTRVCVNEFGYITDRRLLYTYAKSSGVIVDHMKGNVWTHAE